MSNSIDERIVVLSFDNQAFEENTAQSMSTLEKLNQSLKLTDGTKGLESISKAAGKVNLDGVSDSVDTVTAKFSNLTVIGTTALANLSNEAVNMLKKIAFYVPNKINQGGLTRALNIEQARFQIEGLGKDWDKLYKDMDYAVSGTAYGIDEAAKAAAQMSASGVRAGEEMKAALRGISGVAAMTNAQYSEIADVFVTVAANGKVMATDLNRIGARGLNARAPIAEFINGVNDGSIEATKTVKKQIAAINEEIGNGKKVTEADMQDLTKKSLILSDTFTAAMDHAFGENATKANETYEGSLANVNAALSRIGADYQAQRLENLKNIFNAVRETIDGVRKVIFPFTNVFNKFTKSLTNKTIVPSIKKITEALVNTDLFKYGNYLLNPDDKDAKKAYKSIAKSGSEVRNVFKSLLRIVRSFNDILASVFTIVTSTVKGIVDLAGSIGRIFIAPFSTVNKLTLSFRHGTMALRDMAGVLGELIENKFANVSEVIDAAAERLSAFFREHDVIPKIKIALTGLFDIFKNGMSYISQKFDELKQSELGQRVIEFGKKILDILKEIGTKGLDKIVSGIENLSKIRDFNFIDSLTNFYNSVGQGLKNLFEKGISLEEPFKKLREATQNLGFVKKDMVDVTKLEGPFSKFSDFLNKVKDQVQGFSNFGSSAETGIDKFKSVVTKLSDSMSGFNIDQMLESGLTAAKIAAIIGMLSPTRDLFWAVAKGIRGVTNPIVSITANVQLITKFASRFLLVPLAVLSIAGALLMISKIDAKDLAKSVLALGAVLTALIFLFKEIGKLTADKALDQAAITSSAVAMLKISLAMLALGFAISKIASIPIEDIAKSGVAITSFMLIFAGISHLTKNVAVSAGMFTSMAAAILILVPAMVLLSKLDPKTVARGGAIIVGLMGSMALAARLAGSGTIKGGAIVGMAGALLILVPALIMLSMIPTAKLIKAVGVIEVVIFSLVFAIKSVDKNAKDLVALESLSKALLAISGAIMILAILPTEKLLASAISLSSIMMALAIATKYAQAVNKKIWILVGVLYTLTGVFMLMSALDGDNMLKQATALTEAVLGLAALAGAIVLLGKVPAAGAISALKTLGIAFAAVVGIVTILGAIATIDGVKEFMQHGAELMGIIGLAIGNLIGGIIGGIAAGASLGLPLLAQNLSKFMEDLQPFLDLASQVKKKSVTGIKYLADAFLEITAAGFLNKLTRFVGGPATGFTTFASELITFVPTFKKFINSVNSIDDDDLKKVNLVGKAVKAMASAASEIPNSGGKLGQIVGENDIDDFGKMLESFMTTFTSAAGIASTINDEEIKNVKKIASAARAMASMANEIPNTGGLLSGLIGDNSLFKVFNGQEKGFGPQIKGFVKCFKEASEEATDLDKTDRKKLKKIAEAAKSFAEFAQMVPNSGTSIKSIILGNNTLFSSFNGKSGFGASGFGPQLRGFVKCFGEAAEAAETIEGYRGDEGFLKLNRIAEAAKAYVEMVNMLPETGGAKQFFTGGKDFKTFSKQLAAFIESLEPIREYLQGDNALTAGQISNMKSIGEAAKAFAETAAALPKDKVYVAEGFEVNFESFGQKMAALIRAISEILPDMGKIDEKDIEKLTSISKIAKNLGSVYTAMHEAGLLEAGSDSALNDAAGAGLKIALVSGAMTSLIDAMVPLLEKMPNEVPQGKLDAMSASVSAISGLSDSLVAISNNNINEKRIDAFIGYISDGDKNLADAIMNFYNKFKELKNTERLRNLASVAQSIGEFLASIGNATQLSSNIETTIEWLPSLGTKISEFVTSIKGITDDDITGLTDKVDKIKDALTKISEIKPADYDIKSIGVDIIEEIVKGVKNNEYRITSEAGTAIASAAEKVKTSSFADVGKRMATKMAKAIGNGDAISAVKSAADGLASAGANSAGSFINYFQWYSAGLRDAEGFVLGIKSKLTEAYNAGAAISRSAQKGSKDEDDRHSPSAKYFQFGVYNVQGMINGLMYMRQRLYKTAGDLSRGAQTRFVGSMDDLSHPVITPVLDLSEVSTQASQIGTMLNNQNGVRLSASIGGNMANVIDPNMELRNTISDLSDKLANMEKTISDNQVDPNMIYDAVRTGASDSTLSVTLNHRELSRQVSRMGGSK